LRRGSISARGVDPRVKPEDDVEGGERFTLGPAAMPGFVVLAAMCPEIVP
jgi:hypothetical protein